MNNRFNLFLITLICAVLVAQAAEYSSGQSAPNEADSVVIGEGQSSGNDNAGESRSGMIPVDTAIEMFKTRITKNENDFRSRIVLGRLFLRRAREQDQFADFVNAESEFQFVLKRQPQNLPARAFLADALSAQHRFQEAEAIAREVLETDPQATLMYALLGDACIQLGKYDQADSAYQKLLQQNRSPATLVRMARLFELRGELDSARKWMADAVEAQVSLADSAEAGAWFFWRQGKMQLECGDVERAGQNFKRALESKPDYPQALAELAQIESFVGDQEKAVQLYQRALALSDAPPILASLGDLLTVMQRPAEAQKYFERAEALMNEEAADPLAGPAHARERLMYFADHEKRLDEALQLAEQDLQARPDIYAHDAMAWALYKNNQSKQARDHALQALSRNTRDARLFYHAGMIEIDCGNEVEGRQLLQRAIETNPCFSIAGVATIHQLLQEQSTAEHSRELSTTGQQVDKRVDIE